MPTLQPELNGVKAKSQDEGGEVVYLIDEGRKRLIPDHETYNTLFMDWGGIVQNLRLDEIETGPPISTGAALVQAEGQTAVWLIESGHKRRVDGHPETMEKYRFKWPPAKVPPIVLDCIPTGNPVQ
ncbi:MAG TPA: hypothetical protein VMV10_17235 [Pirellulales bacterium]|nr:hypothetical protein [Pirellulales bacterium]